MQLRAKANGAKLKHLFIVDFPGKRGQQAVNRGWAIIRIFDLAQDLADTKSSAAEHFRK